jgi:hypothetical protein
MEQTDIKEVIKLLKQSQKLEDWEMVDEVILYLSDYLEDVCEADEE